MNKKLIILMLCILLISSFYFVTAITFGPGTYIEMFPAFRGTVCVLQNDICVQGTEKSIDFALARVWPQNPEERLQNLQTEYENCFSSETFCEEGITEELEREINSLQTSEGDDIKISMIIFNGNKYRQTYGNYISKQNTLIEEDIVSEFDRKTRNFIETLTGGDIINFINKPEVKYIVNVGMSILNEDGSEILDKANLVYVETINGGVNKLSLKLIGGNEIYTLVSIENEVTEPIVYIFSPEERILPEITEPTPPEPATTTTSLPTLTIIADPEFINVGDFSTINWDSTGTDSCTLKDENSNIIGSGGASGTISVSPTTTTNYPIDCAYTLGSESDIISTSVIVTVS